MLQRFDLTDAADRQVKTYSGGMRRRLDIGASLIARPAVLFLDEPTTGLDPRTRNDVWRFIEELVGDGTTVLLTTQPGSSTPTLSITWPGGVRSDRTTALGAALGAGCQEQQIEDR